MSGELDRIKELFADELRPVHFTDYKHCCECAEHNDTLRKHDRYDLPLDVLHNPGWDPVCFVKAAGFRYLFPRLCELAYGKGDKYYLDQFLFHLENNIEVFSSEEKKRIYDLLVDIYMDNQEQIDTTMDKLIIDRVTTKLAG